MNILIFSHEFPPYLGGVGTVAAQLAAFFSSNGNNVHVLTRWQPERAEIPGVTFHDVNVWPKFWFLSYKHYLRGLNLEQFDHIILNEAAPTIVAGKYFDQTTLQKSMVLVHGLEVESIYRPSAANWFRQIAGFKTAHQRACGACKEVGVASEDMLEKFLAVAPEVTEKTQVRYLGVDTNRFFIEASDYRARRKLPETDFLMVSGSRIVAEKGYPEMLSSFAQMAKLHPDLKWVVCGDGDYLPAMKRAVSEQGLEQRVIFEGSCSQDTLRWIYNACDAFWLISNYREAFPLAYIEAQLTGLPTFGRDRGGVREAIHANTGWLVRDAKDVLALLENYLTARQFNKQEVASHAQRFSLANTLTELESRLTELG